MAEIVNLNGNDIRFEIHGEGLPIVYTPGGFFPLEQGRAVAESLKALGYKVLLWDRPNSGGSGLIFEGENLLRIWADQLHALLQYTGHAPAFISGGSGGYLASLYFAYIYPAEVKALILMSPPTDNQEILDSIMKGTFWEPAETAEQKGMTAVLEAVGGMWDFFDWPDQFERIPQKKQQLLAMDPKLFARTMRAWARTFGAGGRPYFAGLTDEQLATINIPTLLFSGLDGIDGLHPRHTAEALHARLPKSTLVITTEQYAEILEQILRESEEQGDAPLVGRMDEFIRSIL
jgi:2-hydroxy-6-oxonona-2,4-dienedioate hydrolase